VQREVKTERYRVRYAESGMGAPVILIHGLGGSSRWWFPLFPELTAAQFRVLAPDLPGFGASPGPLTDIPQAARIVIEATDRMGLAQFFLVGHSVGGAVAAHLAADYASRVRRLVLIDSAGIPGTGPARLLSRIAQPWSWCPPGFYRTLIGDVVRAGPGNLLAGIREVRRHDIRPALSRVRAPALVIWGEKDTLFPPEHGRLMTDALRDGRLALIPRVRHLPMVSSPEAVARLIVSFFKEDVQRKG
jgi:pimeloyl-ACP methyl ester carboxylesterase